MVSLNCPIPQAFFLMWRTIDMGDIPWCLPICASVVQDPTDDVGDFQQIW